jgi:hypothetical protein
MGFDYKLSALESARLDAVTETLINRAKEEGLTVTREQLESLASVRMATLTDLGLSDTAMDEVRRLVPEQVRARDLQAALSNAESTLSKDIAKLPATSRMTLGHDLLAQKKATEEAQPKKQMSATEEAQALVWLRTLPPAARVSAARKLGLC